ncbi:MAG TPA: spermidine/putrescine ABC transporter substrate-binding protein [Actinomycetota bacterium]
MTQEFDPSNLDPAKMDPALYRGLTQNRFSRRQMLKYAGMGAGGLGLAAFLAACGTKGVASSSGGGSNSLPNAGIGTTSWWAKQTLHHQLEFANWPYYIDVSHGKHPSLTEFTSKTGIQVDYREVIQDNTEFFAKIRPSLQGGQPTGYDIIVMTNNSPPLGYLMEFGWLIPLDHSKMTNFNQYAGPLVKNPAWDPGNKYTMAWQSGYTCLAYNSDEIKTPITSVQSLFDPQYKGHIGMMSDPQELGSLGLLAIGKEPAKSTQADWKAAADKLNAQKSAGLVRNYYDQSYINALKNGDTIISQAWSGDIFQANLSGYKNLKIVIAQEGAMFWTDNMCIPLYAANPLDAMTYMDYVYDPNVQAVIEDYNNYVCPVPAAQDIIRDQLKDPAVANSPTVFPTAQMVSLSRPYYQYKNQAELDAWNNLFVPITQ